MWIFTQQSKQDLSVSRGHTSHSMHFAVALARQHLWWLPAGQNQSPKLQSWSVALYPGSCLQLLFLVPDVGANYWVVVLCSHPIWMSHVPPFMGHLSSVPAASSKFVHELRFISGPLIVIKTRIWDLYFCSSDSFVSYTHWWQWQSLNRMCYLMWVQASKFGSHVLWPQRF